MRCVRTKGFGAFAVAAGAFGTFIMGMPLPVVGARTLTAQASTAPGGPLTPDTVLAPPGLPRIVVLSAPGSPTVALRASIDIEEGPSEGGAGRLLAELGSARARALAGPVAARISGVRTPTGVAYSVTGATQDFDYLAYLLRVAVDDPRPETVEFERARNTLLGQVRRDSETASRSVARSLRERAFDGAPPLDGTLGSLQVLTPSILRDVWRRSHRASAIDVVVVGDLPPEVLLSAIQGMGEAGETTGSRPTGGAPSAPGGDTQILRRWYGEARLLRDATDPRGAVAALLVTEHMRAVSSDFEAHVELWQRGDRRALAVMGAAYSSGASTMRSRVRESIQQTAESLSTARLESAVGRVRKETLFEARTPWGRAEVVGRHMAVGEVPDGARDWLAALDDVDMASMRSYLTDLAARTPVRAELTP